MSAHGGLYLYALVPADFEETPVRAARVAVELVSGGPSLQVVIGSPPKGEGLDALRAHDAVIRALHRRAPALLPFRFDTRVENEKALRAALRPKTKVLRAALEEVRGREQMALRLVGPAERPAAHPPSPAAAAAPSAAFSARGAGAAFLRERAARARVPELDGVRDVVRALVRGERTSRPEQATLRACVYHLVDRGAAQPYLRAVQRAHFHHPSLRLVTSGPDPAWAFAPELDRWQ